jgi:hypothetical protein
VLGLGEPSKGQATINGEALAGDEGGGVAEEERDAFGDLIGSPRRPRGVCRMNPSRVAPSRQGVLGRDSEKRATNPAATGVWRNKRRPTTPSRSKGTRRA